VRDGRRVGGVGRLADVAQEGPVEPSNDPSLVRPERQAVAE
jgi:hypothetical protein